MLFNGEFKNKQRSTLNSTACVYGTVPLSRGVDVRRLALSVRSWGAREINLSINLLFSQYLHMYFCCVVGVCADMCVYRIVVHVCVCACVQMNVLVCSIDTRLCAFAVLPRACVSL